MNQDFDAISGVFSFISWNILGGGNHIKNLQDHYKEIGDFLRSSKPDVLILNEAHEKDASCEDVTFCLSVFFKELNQDQDYKLIWCPQNAIILAAKNKLNLNSIHRCEDISHGRFFIMGSFQMKGRKFNIIALHLHADVYKGRTRFVHNIEKRGENIKLLVGKIKNYSEPTFLCGDWNLDDEEEISEALRYINRNMPNAVFDAGKHAGKEEIPEFATYIGNGKTLLHKRRYDLIFIPNILRENFVGYEVLKPHYFISDHLPIKVELRI